VVCGSAQIIITPHTGDSSTTTRHRVVHVFTFPTLGQVAATMGVQMGPGATALTRMPLLISWLDRERVKAICKMLNGFASLGVTTRSSMHQGQTYEHMRWCQIAKPAQCHLHSTWLTCLHALGIVFHNQFGKHFPVQRRM
jgi:hypothetical protein